MNGARIVGDDVDLPAGWNVDRDNWGVRPAQFDDRARVASLPDIDRARCFFERGKVYVMAADVAMKIDGGK